MGTKRITRQKAAMELACHLCYFGDANALLNNTIDAYRDAGEPATFARVVEDCEQNRIRRHEGHSMVISVKDRDVLVLGALV